MVSAARTLLIYAAYSALKRRVARRFGIHPINRTRKRHGQFHTQFEKLRADPPRFTRHLRMDEQRFNKLLSLIGPRLEKRSRREPISPAERLFITLRYLATGNSFVSLSSTFHVGESTVGAIVTETCRAISEALAETYLRFPNTAEEWHSIAVGFEERWNVPHALGAIDGKHVVIRAPPNSGALFHNYKGTFSTVLLAVADHRCRVIYANWRNYGSNGDAGIFDRSDLKRMLVDPSNPLDLPEAAPISLDGEGPDVPYFFLGDGAFPGMEHLMVPFSKAALNDQNRIYNYRQSRARRIVESTFGLLCARWRLLLKPVETSVAKVDGILHAVLCLHNYLIDEMGEPFSASFTLDDAAGECTLMQAQMRPPKANHGPRYADDVRKILVDWFNGEGAVQWQNDHVFYQPTQAATQDDEDRAEQEGDEEN